MHKYMWTSIVIVVFCAVLFIAKQVGAVAQTQIKTGNAVMMLTDAAQDVDAIDVYIDHELVKANVTNTDSAAYIEIAPGDHLIDIFPAGRQVVLIKTTDLKFKANHTYQLTLAGRQSDWSVALAVADDVTK